MQTYLDKFQQILLVTESAYKAYQVSDSGNSVVAFLISRELMKPDSSLLAKLKKITTLQNPLHRINLLNILPNLEDTIIVWDKMSQQLAIWRGGAAKCRLYFSFETNKLKIATRLDEFISDLDPLAPLRDIPASLRGPHEPIVNDLTPLQGVRRARPGFLTVLDLQKRIISSEPLRIAGEIAPPKSIRAAIRDVEDILRERCESVAHGTNLVGLELSGGIDSTLSALLWKQHRRQEIDSAWSIVYPYFEFRNEKRYIHHAAKAIAPRLIYTADGSKLLTLCEHDARIQPIEPSLGLYGLAQGCALYSHMDAHGCGISLNGNGGDTLFSVGLCNIKDSWKNWLMPQWINQWGRDVVQESVEQHRRWFSSEEGRYSIYYAGLTIDDSWVEQQFEPHYRCRRFSPFIDARLLPVADFLTAKAKYSTLPGKWPLRLMLRNRALDELRHRPGKVAYDGIYVRGYREASTRLKALVNAHEDTLQNCGVNPKKFMSAVDQQTTRVRPDEHSIASILSYLMWLDNKKAPTQ